MVDLSDRLKRYSKKAIADALDSDFADAVWEAADVQPVKHGKWIEQNDYNGDTYYECSCCREPYILIDGTPMDNWYYYCPNCGADMRGE